jgi:hypothetical protein
VVFFGHLAKCLWWLMVTCSKFKSWRKAFVDCCCVKAESASIRQNQAAFGVRRRYH